MPKSKAKRSIGLGPVAVPTFKKINRRNGKNANAGGGDEAVDVSSKVIRIILSRIDQGEAKLTPNPKSPKDNAFGNKAQVDSICPKQVRICVERLEIPLPTPVKTRKRSSKRKKACY